MRRRVAAFGPRGVVRTKHGDNLTLGDILFVGHAELRARYGVNAKQVDDLVPDGSSLYLLTKCYF